MKKIMKREFKPVRVEIRRGARHSNVKKVVSSPELSLLPAREPDLEAAMRAADALFGGGEDKTRALPTPSLSSPSPYSSGGSSEGEADIRLADVSSFLTPSFSDSTLSETKGSEGAPLSPESHAEPVRPSGRILPSLTQSPLFSGVSDINLASQSRNIEVQIAASVSSWDEETLVAASPSKNPRPRGRPRKTETKKEERKKEKKSASGPPEPTVQKSSLSDEKRDQFEEEKSDYYEDFFSPSAFYVHEDDEEDAEEEQPLNRQQRRALFKPGERWKRRLRGYAYKG